MGYQFSQKIVYLLEIFAILTSYGQILIIFVQLNFTQTDWNWVLKLKNRLHFCSMR